MSNVAAHARYGRLQWLFGWLHLVSAAPVIYLYIGLPLVLRQHGWSGTDIGLLQLAGLPALLKFVLAVPVERVRTARHADRNWSLLLGAGYVVALLALAAHDVAVTPRGQLFVLALAINLAATWLDVPVNALAIRLLPPQERVRAGAIRAAATSVGAVVGGGVLLLMHARLGWAAPLQALALAIGSALVMLACVRPVAAADHSGIHGAGGWTRMREWFVPARHRAWALLVLFYVPFVGAVWVYLKPVFLDQGFAPQQIAATVGIAGGIVSALASVVGHRLSRHFGVRTTLPAFAALNLFAVGVLGAALAVGAPHALLIACALLLAVALGCASGLVFGLMMQYARPDAAGLDYGLQSSLFVVTRTCVPLLAGVLLDGAGPLGLLGGMALALAGVLALTLRTRDVIAADVRFHPN